MKTIAIDFDGVIHSYEKDWYDGTIYGKPIEGCFEFIQTLMNDGYNVFIFSTRNSKQIKEWLDKHILDKGYQNSMGEADFELKYGFSCEVIPYYQTKMDWFKNKKTIFWDKPRILGITDRKLVAIVYIDDRAFRFKGEYSHEFINKIMNNDFD